MKEFVIGSNDAGQRLDRFLAKAMPELKPSQIQKGVRTKNIKRNGTRCQAGDKLVYGDRVTVYVQSVPAPSAPGDFGLPEAKDIDVVYEDENIMLVFKPAGLSCQSEEAHSLESYIRRALLDRGEWNPEQENGFAPSLCHRIDRNTEGLVLAAKNAEALRILNQKIKDREISKYYLCVVHGAPQPPEGTLRDYLFKDDGRVFVHKNRDRGAKTAVLKYKTLEARGNLSLLECELVTGRTHQIRVQWASRGFPLLGDGKYGSLALDKPYGRKTQALRAFRIRFDFKTPSGALSYLGGKSFSRRADFDDFLK